MNWYRRFVPKLVSVLIFYLNVYWTHPKLQVISFKVWPLGSYTVVPTFFPLIIAIPEVIFMVQHPVDCNVRSDPLDPFSKSFCIFIQARFFCNHSDTHSAVFRHHSSHHFHILIICWRDCSSRKRVVFNIFSALFESFLPLKNHSSR